mmetsp:Transcript_6782/g.17045  ORF Transcript_6782/g.17045 Transcript_6782/m.17045 type:complete len:203 (-) Transcript_6782:1700-2308(-)
MNNEREEEVNGTAVLHALYSDYIHGYVVLTFSILFTSYLHQHNTSLFFTSFSSLSSPDFACPSPPSTTHLQLHIPTSLHPRSQDHFSFFFCTPMFEKKLPCQRSANPASPFLTSPFFEGGVWGEVEGRRAAGMAGSAAALSISPLDEKKSKAPPLALPPPVTTLPLASPEGGASSSEYEVELDDIPPSPPNSWSSALNVCVV